MPCNIKVWLSLHMSKYSLAIPVKTLHLAVICVFMFAFIPQIHASALNSFNVSTTPDAAIPENEQDEPEEIALLPDEWMSETEDWSLFEYGPVSFRYPPSGQNISAEYADNRVVVNERNGRIEAWVEPLSGSTNVPPVISQWATNGEGVREVTVKGMNAWQIQPVEFADGLCQEVAVQFPELLVHFQLLEETAQNCSSSETLELMLSSLQLRVDAITDLSAENSIETANETSDASIMAAAWLNYNRTAAANYAAQWWDDFNNDDGRYFWSGSVPVDGAHYLAHVLQAGGFPIHWNTGQDHASSPVYSINAQRNYLYGTPYVDSVAAGNMAVGDIIYIYGGSWCWGQTVVGMQSGVPYISLHSIYSNSTAIAGVYNKRYDLYRCGTNHYYDFVHIDATTDHPADPRVTTSLSFNPSAPLTSQATTASFSVQNTGGNPIQLDLRVTVPGYGDFPIVSTNLAVGTSYGYSQTLTIATSGVYTPCAQYRFGGGGWETLNSLNASSCTNLTVSNHKPSIISISPTSAVRSSGSFTLTVNGQNFANGAIVRLNGSNRGTTYVSSSRLTAVVLATDLTTAGTVNVTVLNPSPGGGESTPQTLSVVNEPPTISGLVPSSSMVGTANFSLTVQGAGFNPDSIVRWNGADRATTYISPTELQSTILASDIGTAGTANVTVYSPAPGGGTSGGLLFTINNPSPLITSFSPSTATATTSFSLTVNGSGFVNGSIIQWNGMAQTTSYISNTELRCTILASDIPTSGTAEVTVANSAPGGGTSNGVSIPLINPMPQLDSIEPYMATVGSSDLTVMIVGNGFVPGAIARWDEIDHPTTYLGHGRLQVTIPATDLTNERDFPITIRNLTPGGGDSNKFTFQVIFPEGGDIYERDNTCGNAKPLTIDAAPQQHTFHWERDVDWVQFEVQAGRTYVLETLRVIGGASTGLELYSTCGTVPLSTSGGTFDPAVRMIWSAATSQTVYMKVVNYTPASPSSGIQYQLAVREHRQGVAIIAAGHNDTFQLQQNINTSANLAYQTFTMGGLQLDHIFYLNNSAQDANQDGHNDVNANATISNLQYAITGWAADLVNAETPLYIYLVDHGAGESFMLNGSNGILTTNQLDAMLDALEAAKPVGKIVVIIEACRSGSFISLPGTLSDPDRIIITSTSDRQNAFASAQGASFSDAFFTALGTSRDIYSSFEQARLALEASRRDQTPWLDDNGDGISDEHDGQAAFSLGLANFFADEEPVIINPSLSFTDGGTGVISAFVGDDMNAIDRVWAEIFPPSYIDPQVTPGFYIPELDIERVNLFDANNDGVYTIIGMDFHAPGQYQVVIYASDTSGRFAVPKSVIARRGIAVFLPLIIR